MKITWSRFWLLRCLVLSICCTVIGQTYTLRDALLKAANNNSDIKTEEIKLGYTKADLASARMRPNLLLNQQFLQLMDRQFMPDPSKPFARENHQVWYQLTKPMQLGRQHHKRVELARQGGETRTQEW
nr:hypothetical protein [Cytophagaceae bacterium]